MDYTYYIALSVACVTWILLVGQILQLGIFYFYAWIVDDGWPVLLVHILALIHVANCL